MMMIFAFVSIFITFQIFTLAADVHTLKDFQLKLPQGSPLQPPTGLKLEYLALGHGTQHYVCGKDPAAGNALTWRPHGADAILYDISKDSPNAASLVTDLMRGGKAHRPTPNLKEYPVLGRHHFIPNPITKGGPLMPAFDINHAEIVLTKAQAFPSPRNAKRNVDWLQLNTVQGAFAKRVYRTSTRGGKVPEPQCDKVDQEINEPYAALYSFWA